MPFHSDLELGQSYETKALGYIPHDRYRIPKGKFKPFDIEAIHNNVRTTYEVKCDRIAYRTRNFAIEYECNNQPSGIHTTKADYYLYFVLHPTHPPLLYQIPTQLLREAMVFCPSIRGGDGYRCQMYLIPLERFAAYEQTRRKKC
jgi:hypothetical protein